MLGNFRDANYRSARPCRILSWVTWWMMQLFPPPPFSIKRELFFCTNRWIFFFFNVHHVKFIVGIGGSKCQSKMHNWLIRHSVFGREIPHEQPVCITERNEIDWAVAAAKQQQLWSFYCSPHNCGSRNRSKTLCALQHHHGYASNGFLSFLADQQTLDRQADCNLFSFDN